MFDHVATLGIGVGDRHSHAVVRFNQFGTQPSGQGHGVDRIQSSGADLIKQITALGYDRVALRCLPLTGVADELKKGVELRGIDQGVCLGSVHPVERPVLQSCLMFDADPLSARHGVCLVTGASLMGHSVGEDAVIVEQLDCRQFVSDAFVVGAAVGLEHVVRGERHPSELKVQ